MYKGHSKTTLRVWASNARTFQVQILYMWSMCSLRCVFPSVSFKIIEGLAGYVEETRKPTNAKITQGQRTHDDSG